MTGSIPLTRETALLFLENLLLRERLDLKSWNTYKMKENMTMMTTVIDKTNWKTDEREAIVFLKEKIDRLTIIIQNKDATLVDAGHTHLEKAVDELRKQIFAF